MVIHPDRTLSGHGVAVELFGIVAVSAMVITYALEGRSRRYVLAFAFACVAACAYALLIRSWPFAAVEAVWSGIAFRRWHTGRPVRPGT